MRRFLQFALLMFALTGAACGAGEDSGDSPVRAQCNVQAGPCSTRLGDRVVTMDITPKPVRVMEDLEFVVTVSGRSPKSPPHIDLNMVAMDMGPNRVDTELQPDGSYRGKGVIVKCPSGKKRWKALVTVPGAGKVLFYFDVEY